MTNRQNKINNKTVLSYSLYFVQRQTQVKSFTQFCLWMENLFYFVYWSYVQNLNFTPNTF